jgi:hypothetical protein
MNVGVGEMRLLQPSFSKVRNIAEQDGARGFRLDDMGPCLVFYIEKIKDRL